MNLNVTNVMVLVLMLLIVSCGGSQGIKQPETGSLTKEKAAMALNTWRMTAAGNSTTKSDDFVVEGVQELPQENSAKVNITFNDWEFGSGKFNYSGSGVATFAKYNDGRWVLTKVQTSERVWEGNQVKDSGKEIVAK